jgi:enoyl-CoA hydratase/carnithine racemase
MAPHYIATCKRLLAASLDNSLADHLQLERHGIADSMATQDLARAVPAFFAGETPEFTGE